MSMHEALGPVDIFPMMAQSAATKQQAESARQIEALRILDKDAFKLGDLNPLIHAPDLTRKESVDAVRLTALQNIQENGGLLAKAME